MTPPEPGPDPPTPPEPTTPVFTYKNSYSFSLGGRPAMLYSNLELNSSAVSVRATDQSSNTIVFDDLVIFTDVSEQTRYYFASGGSTLFKGLLDNNFDLHITCTCYEFSNGVQTGTEQVYVDSFVPSDYVSTILSGDFELERRS